MSQKLAVLVVLAAALCASSAHKLTSIKDACDYACVKSCLYLGGVDGGRCYHGYCVCDHKPSSPKPPVTVRSSGQLPVKPPFFHFAISVPDKWVPKKVRKHFVQLPLEVDYKDEYRRW